jgi:hypothetical protein
MTTGLWIGVIIVALAVLTETLVFWKRRTLLKAKEQRFRFHDFRDRLQMLTIEGKIRPDSNVYGFLLLTINIAIRNAGVIKLSQLLDISRSVKSSGDHEFGKLQADILEYPREVQELSSEVLNKFAWMLLANDDLAVWLFKGLNKLTEVTNEAVVRCAKWVVSRIVPVRVRVVREANEYARLGQRLARSY